MNRATPTDNLLAILESWEPARWGAVERCIRQGADPATASRVDGGTILHRAAVDASHTALRWALKKTQADGLAKRCLLGLTPLMWAAKSGNFQAVVLLGKVDPGGPFSRQHCLPFGTPLHLAASSGHLHCVQSLVHQGADITALDSYGRTHIVCAILNRRIGASEALRAAMEAEREELHHLWLTEYASVLVERIKDSFQ